MQFFEHTSIVISLLHGMRWICNRKLFARRMIKLYRSRNNKHLEMRRWLRNDIFYFYGETSSLDKTRERLIRDQHASIVLRRVRDYLVINE